MYKRLGVVLVIALYASVRANVVNGDGSPGESSPRRIVSAAELERVLTNEKHKATMCGPAALYTALRLRGHDANAWTTCDDARTSPDGASIDALVAAARRFEPDATAIVFDPKSSLERLDLPAILVVDEHHAVVLAGFSEDYQRCLIIDAVQRGISEYHVDTIRSRWSGTAIVFERFPTFEDRVLFAGVVCGLGFVSICIWGIKKSRGPQGEAS